MLEATVQIIEPRFLVEKFNADNLEGSVKNSISLFGEIPYSSKVKVQIFKPTSQNIKGCDNFQPIKKTKKNEKVVWIVQRGDCTYSKKAFIAQQSGAFAVLVYHNKNRIKVSNVIPCSDSVCIIKRQQC